jgi:hypothetical protein
MADKKWETVYFEKPGKKNTDKTLRLAKLRADELGIENIVIASYTGYTGVKASKVFKGLNLVISAGMVGFTEPNKRRMITENREEIEANGAKIFYHLHSFGTLGRAIKSRFGVIQVDEIIANVLRLFSQGVKVGCEISCMAADTGLIRTDEECIAIGGAAQGADTAIVLLPTNTHRFFEMQIKEIICKPR